MFGFVGNAAIVTSFCDFASGSIVTRTFGPTFVSPCAASADSGAYARNRSPKQITKTSLATRFHFGAVIDFFPQRPPRTRGLA